MTPGEKSGGDLFKAIAGKEYTGLRRIFEHLRDAEMGA